MGLRGVGNRRKAHEKWGRRGHGDQTVLTPILMDVVKAMHELQKGQAGSGV